MKGVLKMNRQRQGFTTGRQGYINAERGRPCVQLQGQNVEWPQRPEVFPNLMTPMEAAMFLRLDQTGHNPDSACRTLNYWRDRGELKATKFARRVWYRKTELEQFLVVKTEE